jgi:hypothetical protein
LIYQSIVPADLRRLAATLDQRALFPTVNRELQSGREQHA